ncbi:MAG: hypothetical protein Q4F43_00695 [Eubacteriales bacterium]|nr:hypothetical protein [Eubacteriales bacterium]
MKRMKTVKTVSLVLLMVAVLLSACGGFTYTVTSMNNKTTVEVKDAKDGDSADSEPVQVGAGRVAVVESSLEKGQMQIEFVEVTVFESDDENADDEVIEGDVAYTVTVGAGEQQQLEVAEGTYILRFSAVEEASGKLVVSFEKQ